MRYDGYISYSHAADGKLAPALQKALAMTASYIDGEIAVWPLKPDDWIDIGCSVFERDFTDAEKDRFGIEGIAPICPG